MVYVALPFLGTATFKGGSTDDFAAFMSEATGKSVIVALGSEVTLPSLTYDPIQPTLLAAELTETPLRMERETADAFSDQCVVGDHFRPIAPALPGGAKGADRLKKSPLKDGLVTLDTSKSGPIKLSALMNLTWSKPLGADYLLQDLALSVHVKNLPEAAFLKLVGAAVGASVTVVDEGFYLRADSFLLHLKIKNTLDGRILVNFPMAGYSPPVQPRGWTPPLKGI